MTIVERLLCLFFKHVDIEKDVDGRKVVYLRRWFIWNGGKKGAMYLHKMFRSDEDPDPHDHPWDFTTRVLKGRYFDESYVVHGPPKEERRLFNRIEIMDSVRPTFRPATHLHRVRGVDPEHPVWTLVKLGPYRRIWGFVKESGEWVPWRNYLDFWGDDPYDRVGRTIDERDRSL